jgi:uncharacterized protein (DUF486 family)
MKIAAIARAAVLLAPSNVFMTFARYAHLNELRGRPLTVAATVFCGIAPFNYLLQLPGLDYLWPSLCIMGAV